MNGWETLIFMCVCFALAIVFYGLAALTSRWEHISMTFAIMGLMCLLTLVLAPMIID